MGRWLGAVLFFVFCQCAYYSLPCIVTVHLDFLFFYFFASQSRVLKNRNITNNITSQCARGEEGKIRSPMCAVFLYVFTVLSQPFSDFPCHHITHPWSLFILCSLFNAFTDSKSPATPPKMSERPHLCFYFDRISFSREQTQSSRGGEVGWGGRQSIRVIMGLKHLKASGHPDTTQCEGPEEQGNITALIF